MSRNGTTFATPWALEPPYRVVESDYFAMRCQDVALEVPRLPAILAGVRQQLEHAPRAWGHQIGGAPGDWCLTTRAGADAAALRFYYSIEGSTVRLEMVLIAGGEPPIAPPDPRMM